MITTFLLCETEAHVECRCRRGVGLATFSFDRHVIRAETGVPVPCEGAKFKISEVYNLSSIAAL